MSCPHCYYPNPAGSTFCTNCGKALVATGQAAPQSPSPLPPPSAAASWSASPANPPGAPAPASARIGLTVTPPELTLAAGARVVAMLSVVNQGTTVDEFTLHVDGLPREWWDVSPPTISLFPGDRGQAQLTLTAPKSVESTAATYPFQVIATSRQNERDVTAAPGRVELLPFGEFSMTITPDRARGRSGAFTLLLSNRRSEPRQVQLTARDPEEALRYDDLPAAPLALSAGAEAPVPLRVRPKDGTLVGPERVYRFRITASPPGVVWEEGEARAVEAELAYTPRLEQWPWASWPRWAKRLAMIALPLLALLVALLLAGRDRLQGGGGGAPATVQAGAPTAVLPTVPGATPGNTPPRPGTPTSGARTPSPAPGGGAPGGGGGSGGGAATVPTIVRFELAADPRDSTKVQLVWDVQGQADEVTVNGNKVRPKDAMAVDTTKDQTYTLVAKNRAGSATASVGVVVLRAPARPEFRASPNPVRAGEAVTLTWKADGATDITINGGPVNAPEGTQRVDNLQATTTFLLVAKNAYGQSVAEVTVTVNPP